MRNTTKKVGIVTLHGYHNYGNKLQNYALQKVLNDLNYLADTLILNKHRKVFSTLNSKVRTILLQSPSKSIAMATKRLRHKRDNNENKKLVECRTYVFKQFSKAYLSEKFFKLDQD
ncbi:MAG: hypothetical protein GX962_09640, partial [Epulopiscium sp.]|nr:hypothetical protein [Candidatus Epulonipiscium sp.]